MSAPIKESVMYVDIDTILDTRFACILKHYGVKVAADVIDHKYHDRWVDKFHGIDYVEFQNHYKNRDKSILPNAMRTPVVGMLNEFVVGTLSNSHNSPFTLIPRIVLNVYPYELTIADMSILQCTLLALVNDACEVDVMRMGIEDITPTFVNSNFSVLLLYDYDVWLETHSTDTGLKKVTCPDVCMFTPMMFKRYPLSDADRRQIAEMKVSPFETLAKIAEPFIRIMFLPASHFSLPVRPKQEANGA